jgi:hypothetical protein
METFWRNPAFSHVSRKNLSKIPIKAVALEVMHSYNEKVLISGTSLTSEMKLRSAH